MADEEFPHGRRYYTKSGYFKSLSDHAIDVWCSPSPPFRLRDSDRTRVPWWSRKQSGRHGDGGSEIAVHRTC